MKSFFTLSIFVCCSFNLSASFKNEAFTPTIKSVKLESSNSNFDLPIITLNSAEQINLSFDLLSNDAKEFSYTFMKCDALWEKSENIFYHDFAEGMEDQFITDFEFSENTTTNYIHYTLDFPSEESKFLISGNYVLIVKDVESSNVVMTQKFYVVESKTKIIPAPKIPITFDFKNTHHLINFTVNHSLVPSDNPMNEFRAVVIQNGRYDNAKYNLKPSFVKNNQLLFDDEKFNMFEAGNEYRILDFRDLKQVGQGVEEIFYQDSIYHVIPTIDYKRAYSKYKQTFDNNGQFYIEKKPSFGNPNLTSDYAYVHFRFARKIPLDSSSVFVLGNLNDGEIKRTFKMTYKDSLEHYEAHILLKQGVYDYAYASKKIGDQSLIWENTDGTHYQTKNTYTILIYYKGFNDESETLIGVKRFIFQ
ncbi:MAG: hypothetical protein CMP67_03225 [Flavobacteriales bacterium]|nr:hypothetical protein [Flavobacteriales bacterium]|tara:strand:+ start:76 stop:1329 length:1254 start_codon:yes stop_codon:yes gene_type:complete